MAEQESQEGSGDQKPAGKGGLIVTLIVAIAAIAGGISLPFAMEHLTVASADAGDGDEQQLPEPEPEEEIDFIPFDEVTVNLNEARFSRFLRLNFSLQVAKSQKADIEKLVESKAAIFKNWMQVHLSEKSTEDLNGSFNRNRIRREMQDFFNKILFDDGIERVQEVLFDEFHVQ